MRLYLETLTYLLIHGNVLVCLDANDQPILDGLIERPALSVAKYLELQVTIINEGHGTVAFVTNVE